MPPIKDSDKEYEAGRELDAIVAIKLGFWKVMPRCRSVVTSHGMRVSGFVSRGDCERYIKHKCERYSTDIAAAWKVVDKLHADGECLTLSYAIHDLTDQKKWMAEFRLAGAWAIADTALLAICRAALKAVNP